MSVVKKVVTCLHGGTLTSKLVTDVLENIKKLAIEDVNAMIL